MAVSPTYPGVYLTETAVAPHSVVPATTNLTAFLGAFPQGPTDRAVFVTSWPDFTNQFGDIDGDSLLATYGVYQFFLNGGIGAWILRLMPPAADETPAPAAASAVLGLPQTPAAAAGAAYTRNILITANSAGTWANDLVARFDPGGSPASPNYGYVNFTLSQVDTTTKISTTLEAIPNLAASDLGQLAAVLTSLSSYVTASTTDLTENAPAATTPPPPTPPVYTSAVLGTGTGNTPGTDPTWAPTTSGSGADAKTVNPFIDAIMAELQPNQRLDHIAPAFFNLMCIPDLAWYAQGQQLEVITQAIEFCAARQAFLIVDPPPPPNVTAPDLLTVATVDGKDTTESLNPVAIPYLAKDSGAALMNTWGKGILSPANTAGAVYYPWLEIPDPATSGALTRAVPPSGSVAGVYATTDGSRGVWKAPAGTQATLRGVTGLADPTITDALNGSLNVSGINVLRTFPVYGTIVWGARTLAGNDLDQTLFRYLSVRRLTDFIEQSIMQSLRWAVFEPNGPGLWSSITLEVSTFMTGLFNAGAFEGTSASQAFSVVCDATTTSSQDMLNGVVNVNVGFAPVEPAEYVFLNVTVEAAPAAS